MKEYSPLKNLSIFVNDTDTSFIIGNHTSPGNVRVSLGYSSVYVDVSNYQASDATQSERAYIYIDALINKYNKDAPTGHHPEGFHTETVEKLNRLKAAKWRNLGH